MFTAYDRLSDIFLSGDMKLFAVLYQSQVENTEENAKAFCSVLLHKLVMKTLNEIVEDKYEDLYDYAMYRDFQDVVLDINNLTIFVEAEKLSCYKSDEDNIQEAILCFKLNLYDFKKIKKIHYCGPDISLFVPVGVVIDNNNISSFIKVLRTESVFTYKKTRVIHEDTKAFKLFLLRICKQY